MQLYLIQTTKSYFAFVNTIAKNRFSFSIQRKIVLLSLSERHCNRVQFYLIKQHLHVQVRCGENLLMHRVQIKFFNLVASSLNLHQKSIHI